MAGREGRQRGGAPGPPLGAGRGFGPAARALRTEGHPHRPVTGGEGGLADGAGHAGAVAGGRGGVLVGPALEGEGDGGGERAQQRVGGGAEVGQGGEQVVAALEVGAFVGLQDLVLGAARVCSLPLDTTMQPGSPGRRRREPGRRRLRCRRPRRGRARRPAGRAHRRLLRRRLRHHRLAAASRGTPSTPSCSTASPSAPSSSACWPRECPPRERRCPVHTHSWV
jgi:hypothetical protein